jgi:hypothetical protein
LATLFTGVVILATVVVGLVQLAELRRATQLEGVMAVADRFGEPEFLEGLRFVRHEFEDRLKNDVQFREQFFSGQLTSASHPEHRVLMSFELVGAYIKHRLVNGEAIFDLAALRILRAWDRLGPAVAAVREATNNSLAWENAEFLAGQASKWLERHTPKNTGRRLRSPARKGAWGASRLRRLTGSRI